MKDIESEADVKLMVDSFYAKVQQDDLIGPIFGTVAGVDWDAHLPKMYNFWNTIIFARGDYKGSPFDKHIPLPISKPHFERWLSLFNQNMDELFVGPKADEIKQRAYVIGWTFESKMSQLKSTKS